MTSLTRWDRAAAVRALADGRRLPAITALPANLPSVGALFDFMRDAELRFATLRMRIIETGLTTRGDQRMRHPRLAEAVARVSARKPVVAATTARRR